MVEPLLGGNDARRACGKVDEVKFEQLAIKELQGARSDLIGRYDEHVKIIKENIEKFNEAKGDEMKRIFAAGTVASAVEYHHRVFLQSSSFFDEEAFGDELVKMDLDVELELDHLKLEVQAFVAAVEWFPDETAND